jgi:hypothetical protein
LLAAGYFSEAVFAGAMLSGEPWARTAHAVNAGVMIALTAAMRVAAFVTLRRITHGLLFSLAMLSLAAAAALQIAAGKLSAEGFNLMWVHVPLGVAVIGLALCATFIAYRLGT